MKNPLRFFQNTIWIAILIMTTSCEAIGDALGLFFQFLVGAFIFGAILTVIGVGLMLLVSFFQRK